MNYQRTPRKKLFFKTAYNKSIGIIKKYRDIGDFLKGNKYLIAISFMVFVELILFYIVNGVPDDHYRIYLENTKGKYQTDFTFIFFENMKSALLQIGMGGVILFCGNLLWTMMVVKAFIATFKQLLYDFSFHTILFSILPHGVFEIFVMVFSFILANILSKEIVLSILQFIMKKDNALRGIPIVQFGIKRTIVMILFSIAFVIVPMLFLAAIVEVTISPLVLFILR